MEMKSIKTKIVVMSGCCLVVTILILVFLQISQQNASQNFITSEVSKLIEEGTRETLTAAAEDKARYIQSKLEVNIITARTIANSFKAIRQDEKIRSAVNLRKVFNDILLTNLKDNREFLGTYSAWEPNGIDDYDSLYANNKAEGYDASGRFVPYWNRDTKGNIARQALVGYEDSSTHPNGIRKGGWYLSPRETGKENILDPFPYIVQGKTDWLTTMSVPIEINGKFLGIAGTDIRLGFVQKLSEEVAKKLYDGQATVKVISNQGIIVANSGDPTTVGLPLSQLKLENAGEILAFVKEGKKYVDLGKESGLVRVLAPVSLGRTGTPWATLIEVKREVVFAKEIQLDQIINEKNSSNTVTGVLAGGAAAILGCLVIWILTNGIVTPIKKAVSYAESVATGDFEQKLDVNQADEIGVLAKALKAMVENLKNMILEAEEKSRQAEQETERANIAVDEATEAKLQADKAQREGKLQAAHELEEVVNIVSSASSELTDQIEHARNGIEEQSVQITETSTAMVQMNATVLEVAHNASNSAETAGKAKEEAMNGSTVVTEVLSSMEELQGVALQLKEDVITLGADAESIGAVMEVISDIADQTNLLALNAAIEAARAGEAGRGFAVVADEVRKLAEKTMDATQKVGKAITQIQQGTKDNIKNVEKAVLKIDETTKLSSQSGEALNSIVSFVQSTSDQAQNIATAAEEQSAASEQINQSLSEVSRISSETTLVMNDSAQAVEAMAKQANILQDLINQMKE
ncbi:methyl-accepting chemotaxis protein [Desulfovibrio sp. UCD-KL4C]|uniref:methyl-accepting chemotaxis protein n=1 Tax=Desulfovibrio sp. UCD-KL4C TaxID=2578120 RepID=UPI0025BE51BE|nr:methyl-accepting chemotaxis protein [Desulfovibrio sp. UCD-KL4C]